MKYLFTILFSFSVFAQSQFSIFINHVNSLSDPQQKSAAIDSFMTYARTAGIPFIEGNTANFIYRADKNIVKIAGDFTNWNDNIQMLKLSGTNLFYYSKQFEMNARLDYKFVSDGAWILDPENPRKIFGGFGPNSELAMPEYIQPWEVNVNPAVPKGTLLYKIIPSINTGTSYNVTIYLPPGYDSASAERYPSVYFQDGTEYVNLGSSATVMNNLIDSGLIIRVIGIFVQPTNRAVEYAGDMRNQYRLFFVNELVPLIDSLYKTIPDPASRTVIGDSWGGNISALISYNHPDVFGNCGMHSGALLSNNYEAYNLIINGPVKNIKFASVWGTYESLFAHLRDFRDSITAKGYQLRWLELPEGHSWGLWRATTDYMLQYFIPGSASDVKETGEIQPLDFELFQNYPNPFNPSTFITFSIKKETPVTLKIYDSLGSEVRTLVNNIMEAGIHKINFNADELSSGVYFYSIYAENFFQTRKMLLMK